MLGGSISYVNGLYQIVQLGNYCHSFIRVASIDTPPLTKNRQRKITLILIHFIRQNRIVLHAGKQRTRSTEFGAMIPVIEKSITELKPKPKLLRFKHIVNKGKFLC